MTTKIINNFNSLSSEDLSIIEGEGVIGCVAGATGSPVLRFLTGTSVGTHTLPIVGTIQVGYLGHGQEPVLEWLHFVEFS
ncbi:DNA-binding response regulator [Streptococcus thermophilus MTCC 5460]|uniref:hypothetical protein n=1 Tax=Streptococcus thermophilus TaxID=1308 RepID=UPI0002AE9699|nr:hypothetical protein [Streptococcus thermophilus]ELW73555.1 DNA-binding response regulator [Streptococcus thermophilus MTCC 5461]ELW73651.1 DNA-binding response regulator [Streptococcus thermophilus MTCC 5460]